MGQRRRGMEGHLQPRKRNAIENVLTRSKELFADGLSQDTQDEATGPVIEKSCMQQANPP